MYLFCNNLLCINPNYIIFLCILNVWLFNLWSILDLRLLVPNINSVILALKHVRNLTESRVGLGNHMGLYILKLRRVWRCGSGYWRTGAGWTQDCLWPGSGSNRTILWIWTIYCSLFYKANTLWNKIPTKPSAYHSKVCLYIHPHQYTCFQFHKLKIYFLWKFQTHSKEDSLVQWPPHTQSPSHGQYSFHLYFYFPLHESHLLLKLILGV